MKPAALTLMMSERQVFFWKECGDMIWIGPIWMGLMWLGPQNRDGNITGI